MSLISGTIDDLLICSRSISSAICATSKSILRPLYHEISQLDILNKQLRPILPSRSQLEVFKGIKRTIVSPAVVFGCKWGHVKSSITLKQMERQGRTH